MMNMRTMSTKFVSLMAIMAALCLLTSLGASEVVADEKPIKWKAQCVYGSGLQFYKSAAYFAESVKKMSNGRMIIQMNTGGSIVPPFSEQEAVHKGYVSFAVFQAFFYCVWIISY